MKIKVRLKKICLACLDKLLTNGYTHLRSASSRVSTFDELNIGTIGPLSLFGSGGAIDYHVVDIHVLKTKPVCRF